MASSTSRLGSMFSTVFSGVMNLSNFSPRPITVTESISDALDTSFMDSEPTSKKFAFELVTPQTSLLLDVAVSNAIPVLLAAYDHDGMRLATSSETVGIVSRLPHESLENVSFVFALGDEATVKDVDKNWGHTRIIIISHECGLFLGGVAEEFGKLDAGPMAKDCFLLVREVA